MYKSIIAAISVSFSVVSLPAIGGDLYGTVNDPHTSNESSMSPPTMVAGSGGWKVSRFKPDQVGRYKIEFDQTRATVPVIVVSGTDPQFPDRTADNIVTVINPSRDGFEVVIMDVCGQAKQFPDSCNTGGSTQTGFQGGRFSFIVK